MLRTAGRSVAHRTALLCALATVVAAPAAQAAYPGQNGKIAVAHNSGLVAVDHETGAVAPIGGGPQASHPAWSPDGSRVAYTTDSGSQAGDIHVIGADGTGDVTLAADPAVDIQPSWSPDGTRIVFDSTRAGTGTRELFVMNADGTDVQRLTNMEELEGTAQLPAWSPDGTQIAYRGKISTLPERLRVINADGTGDHAITPEAFFMQSVPDWAPDASRVMVEGSLDGNPGQFFTVEPDGSNFAPLPNTLDDVGPGGGTRYDGPAFSPDGTRIVFTYRGFIPNASGVGGLMSQRVDGTDRRTVVTGTTVSEFYASPDWQPVPFTGYARPKGATPMRVPLVTAFRQCDTPQFTPNRTHGPPLVHPSCNPPVTLSTAKVGTPDATGAAANSVGVVRYMVIVGAPGGVDDADLAITVDVTDVRCRYAHWGQYLPCGATNGVGTPEDLTGELRATVGLRITDSDNSGSPSAATVSDTDLSVTAPCAETSDTSIGSRCSITTTADSLVAGMVKERRRAIWQLGQVTVFDGGPDGDAETPEDNDVFLRQGIFVP